MRVVKTGAEGEGQCTDVMEIIRPADLGDIADLGLTLADAKVLLAGLQQALVARHHIAFKKTPPDNFQNDSRVRDAFVAI